MTEESDYKAIVDSGRNGKREPPETQFPRIAATWNAYLGGKLRHPITDTDIGWMMVLFKAIREGGAHDPDNLVDAHGYLYCNERVEKARARRIQPVPHGEGT